MSSEPKKEQMTFPKAWAKCKGMGGFIPCPRDNWANNQLNEFIREWYTTKVSQLYIISNTFSPTQYFRMKRAGIKSMKKN